MNDTDSMFTTAGGRVARALLALSLAVTVLALMAPASAAAVPYSWTRQASGTAMKLYAVSALDANHVWAVGANGTIRFSDGSPWEEQTSGTDKHLNDVSALGANSVWAVGDQGTILHFNGTVWGKQTSGTTRDLYGVAALDGSHVWAVGDDDTVCFYDGSAWSATQLTPPGGGARASLFAVSALDANHVWAVGNGTLEGRGADVFFWNGSKWTHQQSDTASDLLDVSALDATHAWAVGADDVIAFYDGSEWMPSNWRPAEPGRLYSVSAVDATHVWAVGDGALAGGGAKILFFDGAEWSLQDSQTAQDLMGVSGVDPEHVWAVGTGGLIEYGRPSPSPTSRSWGHDSIGVPGAGASETWYLAEGSTGPGFETWVLVQNPNEQPADVDLTYMTETGPVSGPSLTVPPDSRMTFNVAASVANRYEVSTKVDSSLDIVAERAMYGGGRAWGHDSIGVTETRTDWYLAEGSTGPGFETWVLVQNPNPEPADVELTYMTGAGRIPGPAETLPPHSRKSFEVAETVVDYQVSTHIHASRGVVAERAMYGGGRSWGHESIGAAEPRTYWFLAEGSTGPGFETWVLVQNPNPEPAYVELTYMTGAGRIPGPAETLEPGTRRSFDVSETVRDYEVSTKVHSNRPVVAERAMYGGGRSWGHDSIGVPGAGASETWYLAEGSTGPGFETWVLVQNPNDSSVDVTLTYVTRSGARRAGPTWSLMPYTRKSFNIADVLPGEPEVSTIVEASADVIAERAVYGDPR